eukprot:NODE_270_length_2348_cov_13.336668_g212_i0.p1 GENE.NODE_270_length_2348_cov_13.336668_g212_i0~~NODE_270_length_2348_cov_13.336668_g212_i0.p1  ORF type:complete len:731 (+),score=192.22 NODE_270_length_2348_cov_13.336668_g212_i0:175-2193(+)
MKEDRVNITPSIWARYIEICAMVDDPRQYQGEITRAEQEMQRPLSGPAALDQWELRPLILAFTRLGQIGKATRYIAPLQAEGQLNQQFLEKIFAQLVGACIWMRRASAQGSFPETTKQRFFDAAPALAQRLYRDAVNTNVPNPPARMLGLLIQIASFCGNLQMLAKFHHQLTEAGESPPVTVVRALLQGYGAAGQYQKAERVVFEMEQKDPQGKADPQLYNQLLEYFAHAESPNIQKMETYLAKMKSWDMATHRTYRLMMEACALVANVDLMNHYANEYTQADGPMNRIFYFTLIAGYGLAGSCVQMAATYKQMREDNVPPSPDILLHLLQSFNRQQMWAETQKAFRENREVAKDMFKRTGRLGPSASIVKDFYFQAGKAAAMEENTVHLKEIAEIAAEDTISKTANSYLMLLHGQQMKNLEKVREIFSAARISHGTDEDAQAAFESLLVVLNDFVTDGRPGSVDEIKTAWSDAPAQLKTTHAFTTYVRFAVRTDKSLAMRLLQEMKDHDVPRNPAIYGLLLSAFSGEDRTKLLKQRDEDPTIRNSGAGAARQAARASAEEDTQEEHADQEPQESSRPKSSMLRAGAHDEENGESSLPDQPEGQAQDQQQQWAQGGDQSQATGEHQEAYIMPNGWRRYYSAEHKCFYYHDPATNSTTWDYPGDQPKTSAAAQ